MGNRLKSLRKELGLSQDAFGRRLGITGGGVSKLENGERNLTEQMIKSICREFKVDYIWLTKGTGEPFISTPDTIIDELQIEYELSDIQRKLVEEFLKLSKEEKEILEKYITGVFEK